MDQTTNRPATDAKGNIQYQTKIEPVIAYKFDITTMKKFVSESVNIYNLTIIIDEASMVPAEIWYELDNCGLDIIAVGDDGQLEPIESALLYAEKVISENKLSEAQQEKAAETITRLEPYRNYFINNPATTTLKTQHRQATDSAILTVANTVEIKGRIPFPFWDGENGAICDDMDGTQSTFETPGYTEILASVDVVIAFSKAACAYLNTKIRSHKFKEEFKTLPEIQQRIPRATDKLYVEHRYTLESQEGLAMRQQFISKATILTVLEVVEHDMNNNLLFIDAEDEDGKIFKNLPISLKFVNDFNTGRSFHAMSVSYGYALTCHKCQGSQWDNVAVIDELHYYATTKWRYTAVTRAAKNLYCFKHKGITKSFKKVK